MTHHLNHATIGERVVKLRQALGQGQRDFARKLGISQGILSKIEKGMKPVSAEILSRLTRLTGMPAEYVLHGQTPSGLSLRDLDPESRQSLKDYYLFLIKKSKNLDPGLGPHRKTSSATAAPPEAG